MRDNVKRRCIVSSFCPVASLRVQREREEEEQINTLPLAVTFTPSIHQLLLHSTGFLHHPRRCRKELFTRRNHLPFPGLLLIDQRKTQHVRPIKKINRKNGLLPSPYVEGPSGFNAASRSCVIQSTTSSGSSRDRLYIPALSPLPDSVRIESTRVTISLLLPPRGQMTITTDELVAASLSLFTNGVSLFRSIYPLLCVYFYFGSPPSACCGAFITKRPFLSPPISCF